MKLKKLGLSGEKVKVMSIELEKFEFNRYREKLKVNNIFAKFSTKLSKISNGEKANVMSSIEEKFPGLSPNNYQLIGDPTTSYNGLAWAIGEQEKDRWWSPDPFGIYYWPHLVPKEETLETYTELFRLHGYSHCPGNDESFESGVEKVAIYCKAGVPTHVARQLSDGQWTSKLGGGPCIIHNTLSSLEGEIFGTVYRVLIRPRR